MKKLFLAFSAIFLQAKCTIPFLPFFSSHHSGCHNRILVVDDDYKNGYICEHGSKKGSGYYDYSTIKEALSQAQRGDTIKICPGNYKEDNLLLKVSNLKIMGISNNYNDVNITSIDKNIFSVNNYIHDFLIEGVSLYQTSSSHSAFYSKYHINNITFKDMLISSKGRGIYESHSISNFLVFNTQINSDKESVYLNNINHNVNFIDISFKTNLNYSAIKTTNWGNIHIDTQKNDSNYINSSKYGVDIEQGSLDIKHTKFITQDNAIYLRDNLSLIHIISNEIVSKSNGIYAPAKLSNIIDIQNNDIDSNNNYGIYIKNMFGYFHIMDNNISNASYAIKIDYASNKGIIKDNLIKNSSKKGLYLLTHKRWRNFEVIDNCFMNGSNKNIESKDKHAYFNHNYFDDYSGIGSYKIPTIPRFDYHPRNKCHLVTIGEDEKRFYVKDKNRIDNNITTKIVNEKFSFEVYSKKPFTGTLCSAVVDQNKKLISPWFRNYFHHKLSTTQTNEKNPTFKIDKAQKQAFIKMVWVYDKNRNCPLSIENNFTFSKDDFAIRPKQFVIESNFDNIYAGGDFDITFKALDNEGNVTKDYNETNTFEVTAKEMKNNCITGNFQINNNFLDGKSDSIANYDEVGEIDIQITDKSFADVDKDDTSFSNRVISSAHKVIKSNPFDIKVNTKFSDKNITYMNTNLQNSFEINTSIDFVNKQNKLLKNFNGQCYAKDINISFDISNNIIDSFIGMLKINSSEKNDSQFKTLDENFTIPKESFHNGEANLTIDMNIFKNRSYPVSIVDLDFNKLTVYYPIMVKTKILNKKESFYYLRLLSQDIITSKIDDSTNLYVIVYDRNHNHFNEEKLLDWYVYDSYKENNIYTLGVTTGFKYDSNISNINVELTKNIEDYNLSVSNPNQYRFFVIHYKTPPYLWYSKYKDYNDSLQSYCLTHYCSEYIYKAQKILKPIGSGDFSGSEVNLTAPKRKRFGIKIYR